MKSKVITVADIEKFVVEEGKRTVARKDHSEAIQKELEFIQRKYAKTKERESGEKVEKDDVVTLDVTCSDDTQKKFNKKGVIVNVGKGFYDKNLEAELEGKTVGELFKCKVGKSLEFEADVKIISAKHMVFEEVSDENIVDLGYGIETVEEFKNFIILDEKESENYNHFQTFIKKDLENYLIENSVLDIDLEEKEEQKKIWLDEIESLPFEAEDGEESFKSYIKETTGTEAETKEELTKEILDFYDRSFSIRLIVCEIGKNAEIKTLEEFEKEIAEAKEMDPDDDLYDNYTYDDYVIETKFNEGQSIIMSY